MKTKIFLLATLLVIIPALNSHAEEGRPLKGEISLGGMLQSVKGNEAKFNEYRDIQDGVYGNIRLNIDRGRYFAGIRAADIGYKTQSYTLEAGSWGAFRLNLDYHEIPHNLTFGAKTFYSGSGTSNLTVTFPPSTDTTTWTDFDYRTKRKSYGGGIRLDFLKPFYIEAEVMREDRNGIKPAGIAGTTPGGIAIELPEFVNYKTDTMKVEAGFAKKALFASASLFYGKFSNSEENLFFINPSTANTASTTDALTLPPDNDYYKLAFKGGVGLPLESRLSASAAVSKTKADANLFNYRVASVAGGQTAISLSDTVFNGEYKSSTYALVLTSEPLDFIDVEAFYKFYRKDNKSDEITTTDGMTIFTNHLFGYRKSSYGLELGLRMPLNLRLAGGYKRLKAHLERNDLPEYRDDIYSVDLRWSGLDFLEAEVGYERLHRSSVFEPPGVASDDPFFIENFVRRFDAAAKNRDTFKTSVEIYPSQSLSVGVGYRHTNTRYEDVPLGLRTQIGNEFSIDADYTPTKRLKLFAYADYERIKSIQFQRQLPTGATSGFDPSTAATATAFNWSLEEKDRYYNYGVGADVYLKPGRLTLKLQYDHSKSNGLSDFTYFVDPSLVSPAGQRTQDNMDIAAWDDYRKRYFAGKLVYSPAKNLALTAGYAYEGYKFGDAQLDDYNFVPATTGTSGAYLTGAFKDQSYSANVVFASLSYSF